MPRGELRALTGNMGVQGWAKSPDGTHRVPYGPLVRPEGSTAQGRIMCLVCCLQEDQIWRMLLEAGSHRGEVTEDDLAGRAEESAS